MKIPDSKVGKWARELVNSCSTSQTNRVQRYTRYKNLYLTGDQDADAAIFNKTFAYIENVASYLYSPAELRYIVTLARRFSNAVNLAKCSTAADELNDHVESSGLDTKIELANVWSLVKGKTFIKLLWADGEFDPYVIQPEYMGVLREDVDSLDKQEAFFHMSYLTTTEFEDRIAGHPKEKELMAKARRYLKPAKDADMPDRDNALRQVILGGLTPFQMAGQQTQKNMNRGMVEWLDAPRPEFSSETMADLIRIDELWVWDSKRSDWTTIQLFGDDGVLEGELQHRNIFAEAAGETQTKKSSKENPLSGQHPFNEFCPNPISDYFWGDSEVRLVALLQKSLNDRINGINRLLRLQERPPWIFSGSTSVNQNAFAKLSRPNGYLVDGSPTFKAQRMAPEIPQGLYESKADMESDFDKIGSLSPVLQGRGEAGVRAQGHAETLVRTGSPRFKDRALAQERSVASCGNLGFLLLKAHVADKFTAWVAPGVKSKEIAPSNAEIVEEPPAPGMLPVQFNLSHIHDAAKVKVDSHSSSPAFMHEARQLLFDLLKIGAATPEQVVEHTAPPGAGEMIAGIEKRDIERAQWMAQHPAEALKVLEGGKKKH